MIATATLYGFHDHINPRFCDVISIFISRNFLNFGQWEEASVVCPMKLFYSSSINELIDFELTKNMARKKKKKTTY